MAEARMIKGLSNEEYHARKEFSSSQIKDMSKTPAHFFAKHLATDKPNKKPSSSMVLGTATHTLLLENDKFNDEFIVKEKVDGRTKEGKKYNADFAEKSKGKVVIDTETFGKASKMANSMIANPVAKLLKLDSCIAEASIFYKDEETGLDLRIRPDFHLPPFEVEGLKNGLIIDVKTASDASHNAFSKSIFNFGYHISASMYCDGYMAYYETFNRPDYILLVVESEAPFATVAYKIDAESMNKGAETLRNNLNKLSECLESNSFPSYPVSLQDISLPKWAFQQAS